MQIKRWKEAIVLCFPGNKNVLGAAEVVGLMRIILHSPSTNSARNRDIAAPVHIHRDVNSWEEDHHCSNR